MTSLDWQHEFWGSFCLFVFKDIFLYYEARAEYGISSTSLSWARRWGVSWATSSAVASLMCLVVGHVTTCTLQGARRASLCGGYNVSRGPKWKLPSLEMSLLLPSTGQRGSRMQPRFQGWGSPALYGRGPKPHCKGLCTPGWEGHGRLLPPVSAVPGKG